MEQIGIWFAKQFDNGLTLAGGAIALCLVSSGIAGAVTAVNGNIWISMSLLSLFLSLLGALLLLALKTDHTLKLGNKEKRERWGKLPFIFKSSLIFLVIGPFFAQISIWILPENANIFPSVGLSASISCILLAIGIQKHKPPLPTKGTEKITFELLPEQYLKNLRLIVWPLYFTGLMMALTCLLYFVR
ncbi:hypothetical protein [Sulfurirhabdus autotrophica]|uniref:Uncharacterized protein n=1 Tax=Sulfurirhabdus autotrophica TaxID=1706046 RepID=A0A4R3Y104_9PROT|nr:hypothetical protein [Sulfurirhabdus autotrophica]TCV84338.1 hypothetical protein EDC63_112103 [Sulfurirhabdus autotrophica]